ncbi:MAG TPA: glycosyltransferase family 39 protein [Thermoanaerobaculia bacterium]|nr:glycosyltransferase family 39 protein [Thermoanaerobaculia bacterium]
MAEREPGAEVRPEGRFVLGLGLIAAAGFFARLMVVLRVPTRPVDDFWSYFERARLLWELHQYGPFPGRPDAGYPPAYPLLLAIAHAAPAHELGIAKLLNCLLGTAFIVLAGLLARRLWGPWAGLAAALLAALAPRSVVLPAILASENLFAPLLLGWVLLLAVSWDRPRAASTAGAAGVVLGLLTLTRSVAWLLGFLWPVAALLAGKKGRAVLAETALVLLAQHAVLLPWAVRNQVTLGRFTVLSSVGGIDLFLGNSEGATGDWYDWRPALAKIEPRLPEMGVFEVDDAAGRAAREWIRENPQKAVAFYFRRLDRILLQDESYVVHYLATGSGYAPPETSKPVIGGPHPVRDHSAHLARVLNLARWGIAGLGLAGCGILLARAAGRRSRRAAAELAVFLGGAAYFPLVAAVFLGSTRFRWPTLDLLLIPAALAVSVVAGRQPSATLRSSRASTERAGSGE